MPPKRVYTEAQLAANKVRCKAYHEAHRDEQNAKFRAYHWANRDRILPEMRARSKENLPASRAYKRLKKYGLTAQDIEAMLLRQNGGCAICETPIDESAHLDHDHATGKNRELLCQNCNLAIGLLGDSPERFAAGAEYLQRHRSKES